MTWFTANATGIQTFCYILNVLVSLLTTIFLVKAYRAASRQAEAADQQAAAAKKQATAATVATKTADQALAVTREQNALLLEQIREGQTPALMIVFEKSNGPLTYYIQNQGKGTASQIELHFESRSAPIRLANDSLGSGYRTQIGAPADFRGELHEGYALRYAGVGARYETKGNIAGTVIRQLSAGRFAADGK